MKRGIILIMCLVLQSSVFSVDFAGGTGEPNDPYQIATVEQLIAIGSDSDHLKKHYVLIADIDLDPSLPGGRVFEDALIAPDSADSVTRHTGTPFSGVLDGQGHTIANLNIIGRYGYDAGLFGMLGGLVMDLHLTDVMIIGSPCGAIAGYNHGGMILRCSVTGQLTGADGVGGLVGSNTDTSIVECRAEVKVFGEDSVGGMVGGGSGCMLLRSESLAEVNGEREVGGFVGSSLRGKILECQALGTVIGSDVVGGLIGDAVDTMIWMSSADCNVTAERTAGGVAGEVAWGASPFTDCYARGSVTGSVVGGLAGEARRTQFLNCYAACEIIPIEIEGELLLVGGLFGNVQTPNWAPLTVSCFWDAELSQVTAGASTRKQDLDLGTGLTTEQMQDREVFENAGWDFNTVWMISEGEYPRHQWEAKK